MWKQLKSRPCEVTVKPPVPVFSSFEVGCSRRVSRRATELWAQFYGDTVQVNAYHRQASSNDSAETGGPKS